MMKILKSKGWTLAAIGVALVMLISGILAALRFYVPSNLYDTPVNLLEGKYSVDGGEWKEFTADQTIADRFHKIEIRGKLTMDARLHYDEINLSTKDVWFELKTAAGDKIAAYTFDEMKLSYEHLKVGRPLALELPDTPGYMITTLWPKLLTTQGITPDTELVLNVEYPYSTGWKNLENSLQITYNYNSGLYLRFFFEALPVVLLFVLVCFFGIFFFPIAGRILGRMDYRYLTFGAVCFFWGAYMIVQNVSIYLNLWIPDPTLCMMLDHLTEFGFITSVLFYFKTNMRRDRSRAIANITGTVYLGVAITLLILQLTGTVDLAATAAPMNSIIAVCIILMIVLLATEVKGSRDTLYFLLSWAPLLLTLGVDLLDRYIPIPGAHFIRYGMAITMFVQIIALCYDLRQQYLERLRYEKMQKELYEANVAVMVSQIQPHFMYNALTSIAMMCKMDPDKAQEATVTFAKYLRGNMDSLKQKEPVPFKQELEHLKKYLYIEQLRFGKKLNVEYDIQAVDFKLPQLSVQPLVENAVKHGVGMKRKGGTVTIATRETEEAYEVIITDDGVGFDVEAARDNKEKEKDGRSHVGMENTKRRIREMCGGEVVIESTIDVGTTARLILPKKNQDGMSS